MKQLKYLVSVLMVLAMVFFVGCSKDDDNKGGGGGGWDNGPYSVVGTWVSDHATYGGTLVVKSDGTATWTKSDGTVINYAKVEYYESSIGDYLQVYENAGQSSASDSWNYTNDNTKLEYFYGGTFVKQSGGGDPVVPVEPAGNGTITFVNESNSEITIEFRDVATDELLKTETVDAGGTVKFENLAVGTGPMASKQYEILCKKNGLILDSKNIPLYESATVSGYQVPANKDVTVTWDGDELD
jgi:hypothetical protein